MPKIEEYGAPQVEAAAPMEVSSQGIDSAGAVGRAVRNLGAEVTDFATANYRRQAQQEASDAMVDGATARADATDSVNDQIRTGKVDTEKNLQDFDDNVDDQSDHYQTAHGRQIYNQQMARTRSMLLKSSTRAQAFLAGKEAADNHQLALDKDSQTVYNNPDLFMDTYKARMAAIDGQAGTEALPQAMVGKTKHDDGKELARNAIEGWAKDDPGKAQTMLDSKVFDTFFDADTKKKLQGEINSQVSAHEAQAARSTRLQEKAQKATEEAWGAQNWDGITKGDGGFGAQNVSAAVRNRTISPEKGENIIRFMKESAKDANKPNDAVFNDAYYRTQLPKDDPKAITDVSQLLPLYKDLGSEGMEKLKKEITASPEHKDQAANRLNLLNVAKSALVKDDLMNGFDDAAGKEHLKKFTEALQVEENKARGNGTLGDLYKSASPNYFGKHIFDFASPMARKMKGAADPIVQDQVGDHPKILPNEDLNVFLKRVDDWKAKGGK